MCPDCPGRQNRPQSYEGRALWETAQGLSGQVRIVSDMQGRAVTGWDMTAALALAEAHGVPRPLAADILPYLESVMVKNLRESHD